MTWRAPDVEWRHMRIRFLATIVALACGLVALSAQTGQRAVSLLITNGTVVTVDGTGRVIQNGAVAVDGTDIVAVGAAEAVRQQFRSATTIDAAGQIVMPGLVNTHTHAAMALFRLLSRKTQGEQARPAFAGPVEKSGIPEVGSNLGSAPQPVNWQSGTAPTIPAATASRPARDVLSERPNASSSMTVARNAGQGRERAAVGPPHPLIEKTLPRAAHLGYIAPSVKIGRAHV